MGKGKRGRTGLKERQEIIQLAEEAVKKGAKKDKTCEMLGISIRTLQRWQIAPSSKDQRKGPKHSPKKFTNEEKAKILEVLNSPKYVDLSPTQIVPNLADEGIYIGSESTIYRVMKDSKYLANRGRANKPQRREPGRAVVKRANEVWSWDISLLKGPILGKFFYLYLIMDVYSRKIVGWEVHREENSNLSSELIEETLFKEDAYGKVEILHSDNGSPMKSSTMLATLQRLGIIPSFSRPRVSNDNAFSESLFRTLKYVPEYPSKGFKNIEESQQWMVKFVDWYNTQHMHSGINYVTPESRHTGMECKILAKREEVYKEAREKNPLRWSSKTRNWKAEGEVYLNPVVDTKNKKSA